MFFRREGFHLGFSGALGVAALALVLYVTWYFLQAILAIITPFIAALVIALLLDPLVDRFQKGIRFLKGQRFPAVGLVFVLFLLSFIAIIFVLTPMLAVQANEFIRNAPNYVKNLQNIGNDFLIKNRHIGPLAIPENIKTVDDILGQNSTKIQESVTKYGSAFALSLVGSLSNALNVIVVPIITFYILIDMDRLRGRFLYFLPEKAREHFTRTASDVGTVFGNYFRGMFTVASLYGIITTLVFFGFGLKAYALLLGVAAGFLYPVPYLGPIGTGVLAAIVSLATGHSIGQTVALLVIVLGVINLVFDNVLVPRLVGKSVGLHPLLTVFALFLGANLGGLWGMLLSVPVAASIQVVLFRLFPKLATETPAEMLKDPTPRPKLSPMRLLRRRR